MSLPPVSCEYTSTQEIQDHLHATVKSLEAIVHWQEVDVRLAYKETRVSADTSNLTAIGYGVSNGAETLPLYLPPQALWGVLAALTCYGVEVTVDGEPFNPLSPSIDPEAIF